MNTDPGDQLIGPEPKRDSEDPSQLGIFVSDEFVKTPKGRTIPIKLKLRRTPHDSEVKPRARTSDPETSHEAAASMEGPAKSQRNDCLKLLRFTGPRTADEIDEYMEGLTHGRWPRTTAGRRLPELEELGLVERLPEKRPTRSGRKAHLWRAVLGLHRGDDTTTIVP